MKKLGALLFCGLLLAASAGSALAIQPGTSGTEKTFQEQGLRAGVLIEKNNTATAVAAAATLNAAGSGVITTESLTTAPGSDYALTLTNNMIEAGDVVHASVDNLTNTGGKPVVTTTAPAAGSVVISVANVCNVSGAGVCSTAFNGTLKIRFFVVKQSALGSD